jgi:hypothetical protein
MPLMRYLQTEFEKVVATVSKGWRKRFERVKPSLAQFLQGE